jgi:hypothetical protein
LWPEWSGFEEEQARRERNGTLSRKGEKTDFADGQITRVLVITIAGPPVIPSDWPEAAEQFDECAREADRLGSLDLPFLSGWEFSLFTTQTRAKLRLIVESFFFSEGHISHCECLLQ